MKRKKRYLKGGKAISDHFNKTYKSLVPPVLPESGRYACELMQEGLLPSEDGKPYRIDVDSAYPADPNVDLNDIGDIANYAGKTTKTINRWMRTCSDFAVDYLWRGSRVVGCQNSVDAFLEKHNLQVKQTHKKNLKQYTDPTSGP